ncbi:MAG TPA: hypothetical protein PLI59_08355 [Candidatus Obscuribacter sp.]|nr:hypothetical protein [Candidatus Obscuribacter sp.]
MTTEVQFYAAGIILLLVVVTVSARAQKQYKWLPAMGYALLAIVINAVVLPILIKLLGAAVAISLMLIAFSLAVFKLSLGNFESSVQAIVSILGLLICMAGYIAATAAIYFKFSKRAGIYRQYFIKWLAATNLIHVALLILILSRLDIALFLRPEYMLQIAAAVTLASQQIIAFMVLSKKTPLAKEAQTAAFTAISGNEKAAPSIKTGSLETRRSEKIEI